MMNILLLCGVTQAGKSTTIRHSVKYLTADDEIKYKYLHPDEYQNPPKTLKVDGKTVCIFLDSPQEAKVDVEEARKYLEDKFAIALEKRANLLVLAFNISWYQDNKTDACLRWISSSGYKPATHFVYLDSKTELDEFAKQKMEQIKNEGYNRFPNIDRTNPDEQGEIFAKLITRLL